MKKNIELWYSHVCGQYAWGKITDRIMRKHQTRYEHAMQSKWARVKPVEDKPTSSTDS